MATCPECEAEIEVDEFVSTGDQLSCLMRFEIWRCRADAIERDMPWRRYDDDDDDDDAAEKEKPRKKTRRRGEGEDFEE